MNYNLFALGCVLLLFLAACGNKRTEQRQEIAALEARFAELASSSEPDPHTPELDTVMARLAAAYETYARDYPRDSVAPQFLFQAAELRFMNLGQAERAATRFEELERSYPDHPLVPSAMFMRGYIANDILQDTAEARFIYTSFIQKFPNDSLADDAQAQLEYLGMSPAEVYQSMQERGLIRDSLSGATRDTAKLLSSP